MKAIVTLLMLLSFSALAHDFKLQGVSPIFKKFNSRNIGVARISLKSEYDYLTRGKVTKHQHCFSISTSSPKLIPSKQNICSSLAGLLSISVTSYGIQNGTVEFKENNTSSSISIPLVFSSPLKTSVVNRLLEVGKCTAISISGGVPPYAFKTSKPNTGNLKNGNEFCADSKTTGAYTLFISDSLGQSQSHQMWTKGPISEFSMNSKDWNILYSNGMPPNPGKNDSSSWFFDFPQIGKGSVHYVTQTVYPGRLIIGSTLQSKILIETTPGATFDH